MGSDSAGPTVVFLGGLGRSGTTLLERVLGEVPGACAMGEVVHLWERGIREDERCGCGEHFSVCPFWSRVGAIAFGGWDAVDLDRVATLKATVDRSRHIPRLARRRPPEPFRRAVAEYGSYYARLYAAVAEVSGQRVVIDSSKHASLAYCLRRVPGMDLRVIHVVRDSRGVAYSWTKSVRRPESVDGQELMTTYSPVSAALLWDAHNVSFDLLARTAVPSRLVRYEDFLAAPGPVVASLAAFVGLPVDVDALLFLRDSEADLTSAHTVSGNPMRFQTGTVPLRRDDAWRSALRPSDRRTVSLLTLPMLARYGYARPGRGVAPMGVG